MIDKRIVVLEQRGTNKLSKEEQAIKNYLMEHDPEVVILEIPLKKVTRGFMDKEIISAELVSGSVGFVEAAVTRMGRPCWIRLWCNPYPVKKHLYRNIKSTTMGKVTDAMLPKFIKPMYHTKAFTGFVCREIDDYRLKCFGNKRNVWISDPVEFVSEFRYYCNDKGNVGCHYEGDRFIKPNQVIVNEIINQANCGIVDIGVLSTGETAIVECSNAYSVGLYDGCSIEHYYRTLVSFWNELKYIQNTIAKG